MAAREEQLALFTKVDGKEVPVQLTKPLPKIVAVENATHEAVIEVLPREGVPVNSVRKLYDAMLVTFVHPDTGKVVSGRIFEEYNDSQPDWGYGRRKKLKSDERFYICTSEGPWRRNLGPDNIKELKIYKQE